jgi:hypothetical protein
LLGSSNSAVSSVSPASFQSEVQKAKRSQVEKKPRTKEAKKERSKGQRYGRREEYNCERIEVGKRKADSGNFR